MVERGTVQRDGTCGEFESERCLMEESGLGNGGV